MKKEITEEIKKLSPAPFVLGLICFFLPFTHISCQGQKVATFTGLQLVTGTTIENEKLEPEPLALLTLVATVVGLLGTSFLERKDGFIASVAAGGIGLIFLLLLKAKIDNKVLTKGEGMLQVEYGIGFWFVLLLFLAAIGLNGFFLSQMKKNITKESTQEPS